MRVEQGRVVAPLLDDVGERWVEELFLGQGEGSCAHAQCTRGFTDNLPEALTNQDRIMTWSNPLIKRQMFGENEHLPGLGTRQRAG